MSWHSFFKGQIRELQIGLRVRDWVRVRFSNFKPVTFPGPLFFMLVFGRDWVRARLFNPNFQASHYHNTYTFHPMSYSLNQKPTWRTRALEMSLVWNSKIELVLNLVLVVQSEVPSYLTLYDWFRGNSKFCFPGISHCMKFGKTIFSSFLKNCAQCLKISQEGLPWI